MEKLVDQILDYCGYTGTEIVRKKHGSFKGCTIKELILLIIKYDSGSSLIKHEHWGEQTFNRAVSKFLTPIYGKLNGGGETWGFALLKSIQYKYCGLCGEILPFSDFTIDNSTSTEKCRVCKICQSFLNKKWYDNNKYTYHKEYITNHLPEYANRNAKRRASILQAIPSWADLDKIKEIYKTCPTGYHVDHIIPLNSDEVCGLHVESNLRHLPAQENMSKSNKLIGGLA